MKRINHAAESVTNENADLHQKVHDLPPQLASADARLALPCWHLHVRRAGCTFTQEWRAEWQSTGDKNGGPSAQYGNRSLRSPRLSDIACSQRLAKWIGYGEAV